MPIKIAIADDSRLCSHLLKKHIAELGYVLVGEATNGVEAIELAKATMPDIMILDVFMPKMNGYDACAIIQNNLGIPTILVTGNTETSSIDDIVRSSPSGVVIKPINIYQLKSTIDLIISKEQSKINLARYKNIVQNAPMMFSLIDSHYKYILANNYYCKSFMLDEKDIVGMTVAELFGEDVFMDIIKQHIDKALAGRFEKFESWFSFKGTGRRHMSVIYTPYTESRGIAKGVVVFSYDSTQLKLSEEKLVLLSTTDQLTGLNNRRSFLDILQKEVDRSKRLNKSFVVLAVDVDDFKSINDNYGHPVGDKALVYVANMLKSTLRKVDTVGRVGGEEFAAIILESDEEGSKQLLRRLIATFNSHFFSNENLDLRITVSVGVAQFPLHGTDMDTLLRNSDDALYEAKRNGKNQYCICSDATEA